MPWPELPEHPVCVGDDARGIQMMLDLDVDFHLSGMFIKGKFPGTPTMKLYKGVFTAYDPTPEETAFVPQGKRTSGEKEPGGYKTGINLWQTVGGQYLDLSPGATCTVSSRFATAIATLAFMLRAAGRWWRSMVLLSAAAPPEYRCYSCPSLLLLASGVLSLPACRLLPAL